MQPDNNRKPRSLARDNSKPPSVARDWAADSADDCVGVTATDGGRTAEKTTTTRETRGTKKRRRGRELHKVQKAVDRLHRGQKAVDRLHKQDSEEEEEESAELAMAPRECTVAAGPEDYCC